ncbi:hypothetical protein [Specibacter cremeus]|uniref:hypothetical protein n=1 Tax=Specibacter cremeus TaxID=1629051 RepID=UPI000F78FFDD|nr:hypothetical protein [Specibacter cremeus]
MTDPFLVDLLGPASPRDVRALQVKLTHVGAQKKPVPSVVFASYHHLVDMAWFVPLEDPALSYANDRAGPFTFAVSPDEMLGVARRIAAAPFARTGRPPVLALALALRESRLGEVGREFILAGPAARDAVRAVTDALSPANGVGRDVMALFAGALP